MSLSEAFIRVEQAKLYQLLLSQEIFDSDSVDSDIVNSVTEEIRAFALGRLETLMGLRQGDSSVVVKREINLPWDEEQIKALTLVADKVLSTKTEPKTASLPKVKSESTLGIKKKTSTKSNTSVVKSDYVEEEEIPVKDIKRGAGFVGNPDRQPFPTQAVIDMMHAQEANKNAISVGGVTGSNTGTYLIQQLLK